MYSKTRKKERKFLQDFVRKGTKKARAIARANVLLLADEGWETETIAKMVKVHQQRVWRIKKHQERGQPIDQLMERLKEPEKQ